MAIHSLLYSHQEAEYSDKGGIMKSIMRLIKFNLNASHKAHVCYTSFEHTLTA